MILATKGHQVTNNETINYFTDADLCILGSTWDAYKNYYTNVRKEYQYYPDWMYKKGRIKILQHFIAMPQIFKTTPFFNNFETQAKENLHREIAWLTT